jgi:PAS domain S-box-containing protein
MATATQRGYPWFWAGMGLTTVLAAVALAADRDAPIAVVLAGPLLAAIGASVVLVVIAGAYAILAAVVIGATSEALTHGQFLLRGSVVVLASLVAVFSARLRVQRERELELTRPQALDAQRLRLALSAGDMGMWRWDLAAGTVDWDEQMEALFGLEPRSFDGSFDTYAAMLHPNDRERALTAVSDGMAEDHGWQFDHRVVWPDGSVHWLEGRGEPMHDTSGAVIGASGVTTNIDNRRRLFEMEQAARETAEQSSAALGRLARITIALSGAAAVDDVGAVMVQGGVDDLNAQSGYFAIVDEERDELVMRAESGYPDWIVRRYGRVPLSAGVPATEAIRTNTAIFIESAGDRATRYPHFEDDPAHAAFVVVPMLLAEGTRAVVAFGFTEPRTFNDAERNYMAAVVNACEQALRRTVAFEAELSSRARLRTLLESSEQLSALDDPERVVDTIANLAAQRIGSWAVVTRVLPDSTLERTVCTHRNPMLSPVVRRAMDGLTDGGASVRHVLDTGEPLVFQGLTDEAAQKLQLNEQVRADLHTIGYEACMLVPITVAGRRLAVLMIGDDKPGGISNADLELALDLGRRGASALERARLFQASLQRFEAEHRIVEILQRTIVPEQLPELPGIQIAAAYRPAEVDVDVGGDWYDAFVTPDGAIVMVVGDVAGHGINAASLMGRMRNALRAYAFEDSDPASILLRLHKLMRAQEEDSMVTAFVARHDPATHRMSWSRAGHPPPLLVTPGGQARFLDDVNGAPLGTMAREYRTAHAQLDPGALMVCYTDGLVERRDCVLDEGLAWLAAQVMEHSTEPIDALCNKLVDEPFVPHPAPDDMCIVAMRVEVS